MATVGWIDFSTNDKNRVGSVLDMLRPEGMVDELGLGTIRDALANELFPGISTIQTRAKYFFIIPYILYEYQKLTPRQRNNRPPAKYLEQREYEVMWSLSERYEYEEGHGVIGISKRKPDKIVRRPSAIYWNGLYNYHFIDTKGLSADSFLRQSVNPSLETMLSTIQQGDDSTGDDIDAEHENMFGIKVRPRLNWQEDITLDLHKDEADFFKDRILSVAKHRLLAELLQNKDLWKVFLLAENFMKFSEPAASLHISENLKQIIRLSHDFSELMYGAHIVYNCQLQKKAFGSDAYEEEFQEWNKNLKYKMLDYSNFNPVVLFSYAKTTRLTTTQFVKEWWNQAQLGFPDPVKRNQLVEQQEANVKGGKARLRWNKTDDVKEDRWLGLQYFDYRFFQARTILKDIKNGISE